MVQRTARDELLNIEEFGSLTEARIVVEAWRMEYNTWRPHSSLGGLPRSSSSASGPSKTNLHAHSGWIIKRGPVTGHRCLRKEDESVL